MCRWGPLDMYRKHRSKYLLTILYEDLQENPEEQIRNLFSVLDIPIHNINAALAALKVRSMCIAYHPSLNEMYIKAWK